MKKNVLVLTSKIPYPLIDGGSLSQFVFTNELRNQFNFTYILLERNKQDSEAIYELKKKWKNVNIISVKVYQTDRTNNNVDNRPLLQKIKDFIVLKYRIFKKDSPKISAKISSEDIIKRFLANPYNFVSPINSEYIHIVKNYITENKVDLIQVEHLPFMNIIELIPSNFKTLYIHHELQFQRIDSFPVSIGNLSYKDYVVNLVKDIEIKILSKYKNIITFSNIDSSKLIELLAANVKVFTNPFPVLENHFKEINNESFEITKVIFQGSDNHHPNFDALDWYMQEIAPILKKENNLIKLYVTGKWSEENIDYLNRNNDFIFTGFIEDIDEFSQNSIMVVPVRIGSGIRTKILYAMAQGLPVISTYKGIEGIEARNGVDALITDDPMLFAENILYLLGNKKESYKIALNGNILVRNNYSNQDLINKRRDILNEIL